MWLLLIQANQPAPNIISSPIPMLAIGCILLVYGGWHYQNVTRVDQSYRDNKHYAWFILSLGAALLLAALLPLIINIKGTLEGITVTAAGGAAAFILVYVAGWKLVNAAMDKDDVRIDLIGKNKGLTNDTRRLTEALDKRVAEIASLLKRKDETQPGQKYVYALLSNEAKQVIIATGRIQGLNNVDVWVNSENTNMFMARVTEHSVSATIRFLGAKREGQRVIDDQIADELALTMSKRKFDTVAPTEVVVTGAGELENSHHVKRIFHVASVEGTPGYGFRPVQGIDECVTNALKEASSEDCRELNLKSIVFPILGTGTGGGDVSEVAPKLLAQAVSFLADHGDGTIEKVYFLAFTEYQLKICREVLGTLPVKLVSAPTAAPAVSA